MSSATSRTGADTGAVTTDEVMTSRMRTRRVYIGDLDCPAMSQLTPAQAAWQGRFEAVIRLMAPGLDLLLAAGDRVSRVVGTEDDWEPPRPAGERERERPA
jgi:hypothetical protein